MVRTLLSVDLGDSDRSVVGSWFTWIRCTTFHLNGRFETRLRTARCSVLHYFTNNGVRVQRSFKQYLVVERGRSNGGSRTTPLGVSDLVTSPPHQHEHRRRSPVVDPDYYY